MIWVMVALWVLVGAVVGLRWIRESLEKSREIQRRLCHSCGGVFADPDVAFAIRFRVMPGGVCSLCADVSMVRWAKDNFRDGLHVGREYGHEVGFRAGVLRGRDSLWEDLQTGGPIPEQGSDPCMDWLALQTVWETDLRVHDYDPEDMYEEHDLELFNTKVRQYKLLRAGMEGA